MPNVAAVFKQEITRLSRKEIRNQTSSLHASSVRARKDIAELKRRIAKLEGDLKRLPRQLSTGIPAPVTEADEGKAIRFRAAGVISARRRLGLSAADFGRLIGVTAHTVYSWEHGPARPRKAQVAALAAIRGIGKREAMERLEQMGRKGRRRG